jgi:hypothetical protein
MAKATARKRKSPKSNNAHAAASSNVVEEGLATVESLLPSGSTQRIAAGIAAAAGGALVLAAMFGVGPTALAGAAGYVAYRATARK